MKRAKVGFIVYGVHKDGLKDPMGVPFVDDEIIARSVNALKENGLDVVKHDIVIATKKEAKEALKRFKDDDGTDAVILFSGTWVWAAHLIGAVRDFSQTGKGLIIWTHPGSQGWRPVGGLVMQAALKEAGIKHKFVYGSADDLTEVNKIISYCSAAHLRNSLNMSTVGAFGGRGMGQTCGVADPSQWMRVFGVDIDSRDTTALLKAAKEMPKEKIAGLEKRLGELFSTPYEKNEANERSLRLYLALKEVTEREGFDFYTIQSFPGLGDDYSATCFAQSMMLEDRMPTSTLSDFNTLMTVYLLTKLSDEPVYYGDLQHIDKKTKEIKIIGDGAVPPSLAGKRQPAGFAEHGIPTEGEAGGMSVSLVCKAGTGVLARLGRENGKFQMVIVKCEISEPSPEEIEQRKLECGIPFWPHAFVTVQGDMNILLESWNSEYACLGYGEEIYDALVDFCELTGIETILP